MPFRELKGKNERAFYDLRIKQLSLLYRDSSRRLGAIVRSVDATEFQSARAAVLLSQVKSEVRRLDFYGRRWAARNMEEAYYRGLDFAGERLKAMNITKRVEIGAQIHKQAVNLVADQMTIDMLRANGAITQDISNYIRQTQQKFIEEKTINKNIAQGLIEGESRRTTSDRLYQDLRARMREEKFIRINGRNYRPDTYTELLARTRTREATTKGTINTSLQYGVDLVQVSISDNACEVCLEFQGKVYSLSGTDRDFPILRREPPFHPNCEHVLLPVVKSVLDSRGSLEALSEFSKSKDKVETFAAFEQLVEA